MFSSPMNCKFIKLINFYVRDSAQRGIIGVAEWNVGRVASLASAIIHGMIHSYVETEFRHNVLI